MGVKIFNLKNTSFILFVTLLNVINFVDRQFISSFAPFLKRDLGLSDTEIGLLTGIVFIFFYTVAGLFVGTLADRYNRTRIIGIGVILWSAFTAISGFAKNFFQLAAPRLFIGIGESTITPTTMSILSDRFNQERLGFAAGFYYLGVPVGVGASLLIAGYIEPIIGWRGCFYLLGFLGLILGFLMLLVKDSPRKNISARPDSQSFSEIMSLLYKAITTSKSLVFTILAGTLYHVVLGAAQFEVIWAVADKGFNPNTFGQINGWIFVVFGVLGSLFGGIASDWALKNYGLPRTWFLLILTIILMPFAFTRYLDTDNILFWVGICSSAFSLGCFYGPIFAVIQELVPSSIKGTVVAFNLLCLNMFGIASGSILFGIIADYAVAQGYENPYTNLLVGFSTLFLILGPLLYYLAGRYYESDRKKLQKEFS
jgi:MFS family permease|tara:strand:- start:43145 stop:44422 length:1278 start_codon:yes stop_codon:yes gene_type:complete